jgi:hypothetical protein
VLTHRLALVLAVPLLLVVGCSNEDEPNSPRSSGSPSAVETEDEVDFPDEGVDVVDPPDLKGVYQQGLKTYVDFERGRRLAARAGRVGQLLAFNATADVVDPYRKAVASSDLSTPYDGDVAIEFLDAQTRGSVLRLDVCVDGTALQVPDGAPTLLGEAVRAPQRIDVTFIEGVWRVTRAAPVDGSC